MANNRQTFLAIGLLSACVIAAQIVLMQLLSFVQWHHFAYLVISIAMLGFGAAGTCIAFFRARLTRNYKVVLPVLAFMAGVSLTMALRLSQTQFLMFDLYHLFIDCLQYPRLLLTVLVFFVPFFFAALFVGILFTIKVAHINLLYFSNLVGSGAGGLLALLLLGLVYPWHAYSIIAVLMLLSGFLIIDFKQTAMAIAAVFIFIAVVTAEFVWPVQIKPSQYKGFSKMLNLPDAKIIDEKQGIFGLTQTVSSPMMRYAPGVSFNFQGEIPVSIAVFTNADFSGVIPTFHLHAAHPLHFTTFSLPYALANPDTVLVLNAGTGYFAGHAIIENARYVVATEPNHQLADIIKKHLTPLLDSLPGNPVLEIKQTSARSYIEKLPMRFNLIVLPVLDAFGGSSGLYAMQENYLMTSEGFVKVFNALKPGGLMAVSCWLDYPVRTPLKILTTLMEMFNKAGIENVKNHLVAIRSWGTITFVAGNQPFALESTSAVREFCDSLSFDPMILPGLAGDERDYYNAYGDKIFFELVDAIILGNADDLFTHYPFYLRPSTDDKPYFSQFLRWKAIPELAEIFGKQQVPLLELGYVVLIVTLVIVTLLAVMLILVPLLALKIEGGKKISAMLYFAALGLGYMLVEIILIQRFTLYFGHPVLSATFVISTMLVASGIGSLVAGKLNLETKHLTIILALVVLNGLLLLVFLGPMLQITIVLPVYARISIGFIIIFITSFFMGMPFPMGLRLLSLRQNSQVPWAWGINGCLSVIAAPLAMLIAIESGYGVVMTTAITSYAVAFIVNRRIA